MESALEQGCVKAEVSCEPGRQPKRVGIRLPHPQGRKGISVEGGHYDAASETVWVEAFNGKAEVVLKF